MTSACALSPILDVSPRAISAARATSASSEKPARYRGTESTPLEDEAWLRSTEGVRGSPPADKASGTYGGSGSTAGNAAAATPELCAPGERARIGEEYRQGGPPPPHCVLRQVF